MSGDAIAADVLQIVPIALVALALVAAGWRPAARRLETAPAVAIGLLLTCATIAVITLAPAPAAFANPSESCLHRGWQPDWVPWPLVGTVNGRSLNVWMFVPLGVFAAVTGRRWLIAVGVLMPFGIEAAQRILPLGRFCDTRDVGDNVYGFLIGTAIGLALRWWKRQT